MANQAVKITPHLKSEKQQSLEDIAIGDLIEINGKQERIYKIHPVGTNPINLRFNITLISRRAHYEGEDTANPCIGYSRCFASIDMLKRGELNLTGLGGFLKNGRNPTSVSKEANKREMETYKEYDTFLREYGDRD